MTQLETYITEHEKRFLDDLKGWLRIPSISTLPEYAGDVQRAAEYAANQLRDIGFDSVEVIHTQIIRSSTVSGSKLPESRPFSFMGIMMCSRLIQ